jgi:hypothetical protein
MCCGGSHRAPLVGILAILAEPVLGWLHSRKHSAEQKAKHRAAIRASEIGGEPATSAEFAALRRAQALAMAAGVGAQRECPVLNGTVARVRYAFASPDVWEASIVAPGRYHADIHVGGWREPETVLKQWLYMPAPMTEDAIDRGELHSPGDLALTYRPAVEVEFTVLKEKVR